MKMWSGRFGERPDSDFDRWQRSFPYDRRLLPQEVAASKAYAEALTAAGALSESELALVRGGLDRILKDPAPADDDPGVEDVHHFVEKRLVELAGDVGLKLHTGRSRNEQIAADLRLFLRDRVDDLRALLADLVAAMVDRAEASGTAVMPSYTHLQRAEPVLISHWWLAHAEMFLRDAGRLEDCRKRLNECPLGAGAVAGTILPLDREALARRLGFARPSLNSIDATGDRDFAVEFVQAAALLAVHLSRLAEDLVVFSTQEFGLVRLDDAYCTGSSAMPQKRNPDAPELLRAHAAVVIGHAVTLLTCVKGLPLAYNKDLQETQQPVFDTVDRTLAAVRVATGLIASLQFDLERAQAAATRGGLGALAAAACLVRRGVPFRRAHEQVALAVRLSLEKRCELEELDAAGLRQCGIEVPPEELRAQLRTRAVLDVHDVAGGTAPARVTAAIGHARERLSEIRGAAGVDS